MSWLFTSGGQSIGAAASASALPVNTQGWFPFGWTAFVSLQSRGLSESSPHRTTNAEDSAPCSAPAAQVRTWCLTAELRLGPEVARTCCTASPPKAQEGYTKGSPKKTYRWQLRQCKDHQALGKGKLNCNELPLHTS